MIRRKRHTGPQFELPAAVCEIPHILKCHLDRGEPMRNVSGTGSEHWDSWDVVGGEALGEDASGKQCRFALDIADDAMPAAPVTRLMPTSITVAPGLSQSARTNSGRPVAANSTSARRDTASRSRVQIPRLRMRHRHRRALRDEKLGEQLADDGRAADHQRFEPGERRMDGPRERDAGLRRAGRERRQADRDAPDIRG
jgi:hypothetical protein